MKSLLVNWLFITFHSSRFIVRSRTGLYLGFKLLTINSPWEESNIWKLEIVTVASFASFVRHAGEETFVAGKQSSIRGTQREMGDCWAKFTPSVWRGREWERGERLLTNST